MVVKHRTRAAVLVALLATSANAASLCFGTPDHGELRDGCQLPRDGANFSPYSSLGVAAGRTYVHCAVAAVFADAFKQLATSRPDLRFVYGESGFARGGQFKPHKSHQNGLSVDFFVPVRDREGRSVPVPTSLLNRWGYDLEFSSRGMSDELVIDFDAIALHLAALNSAARSHHIGIHRIFFDTQLQQRLHRSRHWPQISSLPFSTRQGWWRHDEHYHVDFRVPCQPLHRP
jgi:penicillin-insensitive murein endopeptidase